MVFIRSSATAAAGLAPACERRRKNARSSGSASSPRPAPQPRRYASLGQFRSISAISDATSSTDSAPRMVRRPRPAGQRTPERQYAHALRVQGRKHAGHLTALGRAEHDRALKSHGIHHRPDVIGALLKRRNVDRAVRQPRPALVEPHETRHLAPHLNRPPEGRELPHQVEVRDGAGRPDDIERAVPGHLVRDLDVAAAGIADRRSLHHDIISDRARSGDRDRGARGPSGLAALRRDADGRVRVTWIVQPHDALKGAIPAGIAARGVEPHVGAPRSGLTSRPCEGATSGPRADHVA